MKHVLCAVLLFALPAFATISQRQSPVSQWNSGPQTTCYATLGSGYVAGDLIVVWTYWTTSGTNNLTASVADTYGNGVGTVNPVYPSAVGPTVQSAASSPIAAQIFYAKKTVSGTGGDTVTVQYSGSASTSGCVFVEYQGADQSYPLDSVSAGYSTSGNPTALPAWFQALNGNFRYQLTPIGQFAQAMVANEIDDGEFSIKTDKPNVKVSWQVTAVRQDAYAKAHPLVVEQEKPTAERGYYLHPELFGAPPSRGMSYTSSRIAGETSSGGPAEDIEAAKP